MTIYIDSDFKCHAAPEDGLTAVETAFFDGKALEFVEGYRYVPAGSVWVRSDGAKFPGEMVAPWKPWAELDAAQRAYERERAAALEAQNDELVEAMAAMVEDVYNQDLAAIEEG